MDKNKIVTFFVGLIVGATISAGWFKIQTETSREKYVTVIEGSAAARGFTIGIPMWVIPGRVTPVIYGDISNAKYQYLNQFTQERETSWHEPVRVDDIRTVAGPNTCRDEIGPSGQPGSISRFWRSRMNGDCYVQDAQ